MLTAEHRLAMDILRRTDPLMLLSAIFALAVAASSDAWWSISGVDNSNLLVLKVSPFYFQANATGLSSTVPFAELLGPFTRVLLIVAFVALGMVALNPFAWWRDLAVYFGLSALTELYLSFLLLYHAAETTLLGAFGAVPPLMGTTRLPAVIVGLDLKNYLTPLVTASLEFPFYLGFIAIGLVGARLVIDEVRQKRSKREHRGVGAIFTSDRDRP